MSTRSLVLLLAIAAVGCGDDDRGGGPRRDAGGRDSGMIGPDGGMVDPDGGADPDTGVVPDGGPGCLDEDGDGYGEGCKFGLDCDDTDENVSPVATEVCNGIDDDCDEELDEMLEAPSCELTEGVCAGAVATCGGTGGFGTCGAGEYGSSYEEIEARCDALDNDCDGMTDEGCVCTPGATQGCGSDTGECLAGTQTCTSEATWGPCAGETGPMGESCNGLDDDCDGSSDEAGDLTPPPCALQEGVCAGSVRTCGAAMGWLGCGAASYGSDYQAAESRCDGMDNDCDGVTDEGCVCIDGDTQPCGSDVGACSTGVQTCTLGGWGACAGEVMPAPETCNGTDDDCDGAADEDVIAPLCPLTTGVCAGSRQTCTGAGGFRACGAPEYGTAYEATETRCDGRDNDCDGVTDEGCSCVVGATQSCGSSVGACRPGLQTCTAAGWSACTGGVTPSPEACNGRDDDCNGATDDGLTPPACALTEGVCSGTTQVCRGLAGWEACSGTASYGPRFVATEDGAGDEAICDGLDNDCDGAADEGCVTAPLIADPAVDEYGVGLYDRLVSYIGASGTTEHVYVWDARTATSTRISTVPGVESRTDIYGNVVVYQRGADAAARIVAYDLATGMERVLTSAQSEAPKVFRNFVTWSDHRGADYDVYLYDLAMNMEYAYVTGAGDQIAGDVRGGTLVYYGLEAGTYRVHHVDLGTGADTTQDPAGMMQVAPVVDWLAFAWTDARLVTDFADPTQNGQIAGAFLGDITMTEVAAPQYQGVTGLDGLLMVWNDHRNGNYDVGFKTFSVAGETMITSGPAVQGDPAIHGINIVWTDNRAGNFDIFTTSVTGATVPSMPDQLIINEILADPAAAADPNGDGTASVTQDEFVEIVNTTGVALDLSGMTLSDGAMLRHTFPMGTVIPAAGGIVVFGGGTPAGLFGGLQVQTASSLALGLNNDADTLTLRAGATVIHTASYGAGLAGADQSIVRMAEYDPASVFVRHSTATGSGARAYSVGTLTGGYSF